MKSKPYELLGKLFRYDFDHCTVEYIFKADAEEIAYNVEWTKKHGRPLFDIDPSGYMVVSSVGLHRSSWEVLDTRNEYLSSWCNDLDGEASLLAADFVKYESPYLNTARKE